MLAADRDALDHTLALALAAALVRDVRAELESESPPDSKPRSPTDPPAVQANKSPSPPQRG